MNKNSKTLYFGFLIVLVSIIYVFQSTSTQNFTQEENDIEQIQENSQNSKDSETVNKVEPKRSVSSDESQKNTTYIAPTLIEAYNPPAKYQKILSNAVLEKSYQYKGADVKIYKRSRGGFKWVRLETKKELDESVTTQMTRADQLLIRLNEPENSMDLQDWMKEKDPNFKVRPFLDDLYVASFSVEDASYSFEEVTQFLLSKPEWVKSVSEDFVYLR